MAMPRLSRRATEHLLTEIAALHLKARRLPVPAQRLRDARRRPQYTFSRTEAADLRRAVREIKTLARGFLRRPDTPTLRRLLADERLTASRWVSRALLEQLRRNEVLAPEYLEQAVGRCGGCWRRRKGRGRRQENTSIHFQPYYNGVCFLQTTGVVPEYLAEVKITAK